MIDPWFSRARSLFGRAPLLAPDLPALTRSDDTRRWASVPVDALPRAIAPLWLATAATLLLHAILAMAAPLLLREVIAAIRDPQGSTATGLLAAAGLALTSGAAWLAISHGFVLAARVAIRIRASLVRAVYDKLLRRAEPGDPLVNLVTIDVERVSSGVADGATLLMSLVSVGAGVGLLFALLGWPAAASVAVLAALSALSHRQAGALDRASDQATLASDLRLARLGELLAGIRTVKLAGWERAAIDRLAEPRAGELVETRRYAIGAAWLQALFLGSPVLLVAATFATVSAAGRPLVASDAFAAIALFGLLRPSLLHLPWLVMSVVGARVSMRRISAWLEEPERPRAPDGGETGRIALCGASFRWADGATALDGIDLEVAPGELVALVGPIGSGKTALVRAILGELDRSAGTSSLRGRLAVASQEPLLIHGSVADNVVFGRPFDPARLARALSAAALDGEELPASVGERGTRLSGGQRQRVALARALYGDADLVVLDDPISALDPAVGQQVLERAILGRWRGVTRVIATHSPAVIAAADRVVVLRDGRIGADAPFAPEVGAVGEPEPAEEATPPETIVPDPGGGAVTAERYRRYLSELLPGPWLALVALLFASREGLAVGADYWLSSWSERGEAGLSFALGLCALGGGAALVTFLRSLILAVRGVAVGRDRHDRAVRGLLSAPLRVFETTPAGQLLQRFGRDQRVVDQQLALVLLEVAGATALVLSTVSVVAAATPLAILALLPAAWVGRWIGSRFRPASRELRRFDAAAHTPLLAHLSETAQGVRTIRAYGVETSFGERLVEALEPSQRAMLASGVLKGWLSVRLEGLGSALSGLVACLAVGWRDRIDVDLAALAVTHSLLLTCTLGRWVRTTADLEGAMTSLERLAAVAELPPEEPGPAVGPAPGPGAIAFEDVDLRYSADGPLALSEVTFSVGAGEKVSIVGRTGSGKSTLAQALVRVVSPERGRIRLDGVDVRELPLADLRARISVVPQEPALFEGTLRDNLDLGGLHDDDRLIGVLLGVGLSLPLDFPVARGGGNLSAGQRQLTCLARALLGGARVVVLDEVTAHLDPETERGLRHALVHALADATVITVAHRRGALCDSARTLVMDGGRLRLRDPSPSVALTPG